MSITFDDQKGYESQINLVTYATARNAAIISVPGLAGVSGWVFDIPTGESVDLAADISDHFTETGSFVSDHAVLKPAKITLGGFIGNLVFRVPQPGSVEYATEQIQNKLLAVNAYLGPFTQGVAQQAAAITAQVGYVANQINAIKKKATNVINFFKGQEKEPDAQTIAYHELKALYTSKQIVSVQTPWEFFGSMMIESISARRDDITNDYTEFSITLKEMRLIGIQRTNFDEGAFKSAIDAQAVAVENKGPIQGAKGNESLLHSLFGRK